MKTVVAPRVALVVSAVLSALVATGCSDKHEPSALEKNLPFVSVLRTLGDKKDGKIGIYSVPAGTTDPESFYVAINQAELGQKYFLSAYMRDAFPGTLNFFAGSS